MEKENLFHFQKIKNILSLQTQFTILKLVWVYVGFIDLVENTNLPDPLNVHSLLFMLCMLMLQVTKVKTFLHTPTLKKLAIYSFIFQKLF